MPVYMKFEGIKGNATAKGHEGWIELTSVQLGTTRNISTSMGSSLRESAPPSSLSEIVITKDNDESSTLLFRESLSGQPKKVIIDFVELNDGKPRVYMSLELEGVLVSSYQISGHGGDSQSRPIEYLSLNFTKIIYSAKPAEVPKKTATAANKSMWDLLLAK